MTLSAHATIEHAAPASPAPAALWTCSRGATVIEYALALALIAAAAISVQSPRLHQVKDDGCIRFKAPCPPPRKPLSKPAPVLHFAQANASRAGGVPAKQTHSSGRKPNPAQRSAA